MASVIRKYQRVVPDLEEVRRNKYKSVYIENAAIITKESFHIDLHWLFIDVRWIFIDCHWMFIDFH